MHSKHLMTILVLLALMLPAASAQAGGVVGVCDEAHLRAALAGGGMVTFSCSGTITLAATIIIAADTTLDGSGQNVTISGNHAVRVIKVDSGVTFNLNNLTIENGNSLSKAGGGILNAGTLTVSNSIISHNNVQLGDGGGGIRNLGNLTVSHSHFDGNTAQGGGTGAAIWNQGHVTVSDSIFRDNDAYYGGGVYNAAGDVTVSHSVFYSNHAQWGGGLYSAGGTLTLSGSTLLNNIAYSTGGGIVSIGQLFVNDTTFADNYAYDGPAGAIGNYGTGNINNSTLAGNGAASSGGGINNTRILTITNSTFTANGADYGGGGISNLGGSVTASNTTFAANRSQNIPGGGIRNVNGAVMLSNTIVAYSPVGGNCAGPVSDGGGNLSYPDATCPGINDDPRLGPLQNNGGPTETMALLPGSAAIDAAIDAICAAPPVNNLDQRGIARPQGLHCDIGAVEEVLQPTAVGLRDLSARTAVTVRPMIGGVDLVLLVLLAGMARRRRHARRRKTPSVITRQPPAIPPNDTAWTGLPAPFWES